MAKILIVDDEDLVRQDLVYKVGASGFAFTWIMDAGSCEEALGIIRGSPPDILITDIMMFEKSGLDLIEEAKALQPKLVSVIVCGYPNFSFAQRALKLGVIEYLLKPVTPKQLSTVLGKALAEVERLHSQKDLTVDNYVLKNRLSMRRRQESFNALFSGNSAVLKDVVKHFPPETGCYQVQLLRLELPQSLSVRENEAFRYGACNVLEELCPGRLVAINDKHNFKVIAVIGYPGNGGPPDLIRAEELRGLVERSLGFRTDMGVSGRVLELSSAVYQEAQTALDLRFGARSSRGKTFSLDGISAENVTDDSNYETYFSTYKRFLDAGNTKDTAQAAVRLLESYRSQGRPGIRDAYVQLIGLLSRSCYRKGTHILPMLGCENINASILDDYSSLDDVEQGLENLIQTVMGQWITNKGNMEEILHKVRLYIDQNFTDSSLRTKELASHFCISLGYLSDVYRKRFGITISKYIIAKRVDYAASLLRETELPIQSVAENSGFNSLSYFMRVFKTNKGVTPGQYRETGKP